MDALRILSRLINSEAGDKERSLVEQGSDRLNSAIALTVRLDLVLSSLIIGLFGEISNVFLLLM